MSFHTRKFIAEIEYGRLIQISPDKLPCRKTVVSLIRGGELTPWAGTLNFAAGRLANEVQGGQPDGMTTPVCPSYAGYRFPAEVISHAVRLYFRFPLNSRMVEEMLAARGIIVTYESVRQWALKFGQDFANRIQRQLPCAGDK